MALPHSMFLVTYHNSLQGISFKVKGVADTLEEAKESLNNYFAGMPQKWQEFFYNDEQMWVWKIDPGAGIQYVIQEVRVY